MASGWTVLDALNKNSKAAADDVPKARFRTRDISIRKIYPNERIFLNFFHSSQSIKEVSIIPVIRLTSYGQL